MKPIFAWILLFAFLGIASAVLLVGRETRTVTNDPSVAVSGRLEVQGDTDLGVVPIGTMVAASLKITNRSGEDVVVSKLKPDCSCTEVHIDRGGSKERVKQLSLKPNETRVVRLDILVNGEPGLEQVSSLEFQEADKAIFYQPRILHTPVARFYTLPRVLQFGEIRVGIAATRRVELRSDGTFRRSLENISMRSSSLFSMRFTRATEADHAADPLKGQELLGFVDVSCDPRGEERGIREDLTFLEGGEVLGKVIAAANVISDITISPKTLVLPRYEGGKPVYSGWFLCRSRWGKPFEVVPDAGSAEVRVTIERTDSHPADSYKIGFTFLGSPPDSSTKNLNLVLKIKDDSGDRSLITRVMIGTADP